MATHYSNIRKCVKNKKGMWTTVSLDQPIFEILVELVGEKGSAVWIQQSYKEYEALGRAYNFTASKYIKYRILQMLAQAAGIKFNANNY